MVDAMNNAVSHYYFCDLDKICFFAQIIDGLLSITYKII